MKKLFLALSFVAATFFCQAQVFLGGSIGYGMTNGTVSGTIDKVTVVQDLPKTSNFSIVPTVGYMFNENIGIGLDFGFGISSYKEKDEDYKYNSNVSSWMVAPYFRWAFGNFDRVTLYADAKFNFGGEKAKYSMTQDKVSINGEGDKASVFGVNIVPGINFMITDNIMLNAKLNLLSLGYNMTKIKTNDVDNYLAKEDDEVEYTVKRSEFGIGVNYKTALEVGFVYQF